ncbi:hypothetical protein FLBR109950_15680 [Flavobacterium branchiophilum]|uniref:Uncharacterized protein n=1 Tax=Flavobacterium branchiophilum (strain FL-15) TaxID=1034807 RepID=G2Z5Q0_FLABF|nr:hypothetical protein [Flavobacterium branchiophilum]CCB70848.1 Hypothetical protein FBFL15_2891 [Flavobacterium branchiophilum FL-15]
MELIKEIEAQGYFVSYHDVTKFKEFYSEFLLWGFFKFSEYKKTKNYLINPKIIKNKSAFLNIGFEFNNVIKNNIEINSDILFYDSVELNVNSINNFFNINIYSYNIGILLKNDNDIDWNQYKLIFEKILKYYYLNTNLKELQNMYIKNFISLGFDIPFFVKNLKEEYKVVLVSSKPIKHTTEIDFNDFDRILNYFDVPAYELSYFYKYP